MTLAQVESFVESAKQGSFSKASAELYMSQQAISRQVQTLEHELGIRLFQRFSYGIQMTREGELLFAVWDEMLKKHNDTMEYIKNTKIEEQKQIKFGIADMGEFLSEVTKGILGFNKKHVDLNMEYEVSTTRELLKKLEQGDLNMVITYRSELEKYPHLRCSTLNKAPLKVGIYMSKRNPLAAKRALSLQDLAGQTIGFLGKSFSNDHKDRLDMVTKRAAIYENLTWKEYNSRQSLSLAVITEKCITIVFKRLLEGFDDSLVFHPLEEYTDWYDIVVAWKDDKYASLVEAFTEEYCI